MKRTLLLFALLSASALAAPPPADPLVDALRQEMQRNLEGLSLPDAPPIHHLRYTLERGESYSASASFGALLREDSSPLRSVQVEVRVGSPEWDNTGFAGRDDGFASSGLPEELTARALRQQVWRLTDGAYKDAVEHYGRKSAELERPPDHPGDYSPVEPLVDSAPPVEPVDTEGLAELARRLSAALPPGVTFGSVSVSGGESWRETLDSEGGHVAFGVSWLTLVASAELRTEDGMTLRDHRTWYVRRPEDLPPYDALAAEITEMGDALIALAGAPLFDEEYVGPVIFEDQAATALFRSLLVPQVEGTPPKERSKRSFSFDPNAGGEGMRLDRRVLPPGWDVVDDPSSRPKHPSALPFDSEGRRPEAVQLVEDGVVQTALMSRTPREGVAASNGHGRGSSSERAVGKAMQLQVTPPKRSSGRSLRRQALKLAEAYDRDYVLIVRRAPYGEPLSVTRLYADGREELLRGASFASMQRYILRDIVAAGAQVEESYKAWRYPSLTNGWTTWISAPEVLVGEVELVPEPPDPRDAPVLELVEG